MSAVEALAADLASALDDELDVAAAESEGAFQVDDRRKASWALRKLGSRRRDIAEVNRLADEQITKVNEWRRRQVERASQDASYFESLLLSFHLQRLEADPKAKTIELPEGVLKARKRPDQWEIDEPLFLPWAGQHHPELVRVKVEVDRVALKAWAGQQPDANGSIVVDPDSGERLPGVVVTYGDLSFSVVTEP